MGCVVVAGTCVWALQAGETALFWAARTGKVKGMALLLDRGADLEAKNKVSPSAAPPACRLASVLLGGNAASSSGRRGRPAARAAGPGARTGERRARGGCGAAEGIG